MIPLSRVIAAEVVKLRSIRSYRLALLAGMAGVVIMAGVMAAVAGRDASGWTLQPVALPLEYFAYVTMIIGVLMVTGDIASGTWITTSCVVPWQSRVVVGKYLAAAATATAAAVVVAVLVLAASWAGSRAATSEVFSTTTLVVVASGLFAVPVATILGVAFGLLLRSTAAALSLLLLWSFVVETMLVFTMPERIAAYLPFKTIGGSRDLLAQLDPGVGLALFAGYAAVLVGLAAVVEPRRDVATV